jgi:hypothetical protein
MASKVTKRVIHYKDGSVQGKGSMKDGEMHGYWKGQPYKTTVMKE